MRPRQHGRLALPRARLRPAFYAAIISATFADGTPMPMALIAKDAGISHPQRLSNLLHAPSVPISTRPLFERIARMLRYPTDHIFIETTDQTPRLVKNATADEARV